MEDTQYIISPRTPVRGFFIAAVLCVLGVGLLVAAVALEWGLALSITGAVVAVIGVILMVVGFIAKRARRSTLLFTKNGYELRGPGGSRTGSWRGVSRVTQTKDGRRITIHNSTGGAAQLVFAPGAEAQFDEMLKDMVQRLDHAKGYHNLG